MDNVTQAFASMNAERVGRIFGQFGVDLQGFLQKAMGEEEFDIDDPEFDLDPEYVKKAENDDAGEDYNAAEEEGAETAEEDEEGLQKSDLAGSILYSENFKVKKSGKDIKKQLKEVVIPACEAELATAKSEATKLLESCGEPPTRETDNYRCKKFGIEVPLKAYAWDELRVSTGRNRFVDALSYEHQQQRTDYNYPSTEDEAIARERYTDCLHKVCDIMVDIKACFMLINNLGDKDIINLNPDQVISLKFD